MCVCAINNAFYPSYLFVFFCCSFLTWFFLFSIFLCIHLNASVDKKIHVKNMLATFCHNKLVQMVTSGKKSLSHKKRESVLKIKQNKWKLLAGRTAQGPKSTFNKVLYSNKSISLIRRILTVSCMEKFKKSGIFSIYIGNLFLSLHSCWHDSISLVLHSEIWSLY